MAEIFKLFFMLGVSAFGGPAAHIAMLHKEVVDKRKWMSEEHFLDLVGATSLIPGPNSTEMVIHCGHHRGGVSGLVVAGLSFLIPACFLTWVLAYFYVELSTLPDFTKYMAGIKPIVIILILDALRKLWKKGIKKIDHIFVAVLVLILGLIGIGEVYALILGALVGFVYLKVSGRNTMISIAPLAIFGVFFKVGSVLFGSGYVLISYLQDELVFKRGWLTTTQLADAIGVGQFTPGPVLSTSTFTGHILGGPLGALAATIGIFLPAFLLVYFMKPLIPKMRASKNFSTFLDCINAGTIGLMAYALVPMAKITFFQVDYIVTFIIMGIIYLKFPKLSSIKLVFSSLLLGVINAYVFPLLLA